MRYFEDSFGKVWGYDADQEHLSAKAVENGWKKLLDWPAAPSIDDVRKKKNADINNARLEANSRTFTHDGQVFACDALSRSDIDGVNGYVALYGDFPAQFSRTWKAVDNSYYPLPSVASWKMFYASMVATGAANFARAQELKAQLAGATTIEEVEAIVW